MSRSSFSFSLQVVDLVHHHSLKLESLSAILSCCGIGPFTHSVQCVLKALTELFFIQLSMNRFDPGHFKHMLCYSGEKKQTTKKPKQPNPWVFLVLLRENTVFPFISLIFLTLQGFSFLFCVSDRHSGYLQSSTKLSLNFKSFVLMVGRI